MKLESRIFYQYADIQQAGSSNSNKKEPDKVNDPNSPQRPVSAVKGEPAHIVGMTCPKDGHVCMDNVCSLNVVCKAMAKFKNG